MVEILSSSDDVLPALVQRIAGGINSLSSLGPLAAAPKQVNQDENPMGNLLVQKQKIKAGNVGSNCPREGAEGEERVVVGAGVVRSDNEREDDVMADGEVQEGENNSIERLDEGNRDIEVPSAREHIQHGSGEKSAPAGVAEDRKENGEEMLEEGRKDIENDNSAPVGLCSNAS